MDCLGCMMTVIELWWRPLQHSQAFESGLLQTYVRKGGMLRIWECPFLYIGGPFCGCPGNKSPTILGLYRGSEVGNSRILIKACLL